MEGMKEVWRQILEESGHSVATAKNMQEAYDHLSDKKKPKATLSVHNTFIPQWQISLPCRKMPVTAMPFMPYGKMQRRKNNI